MSVILTSIASGLLTTLQTDTGTGKWIGYQILYGVGAGAALQIPTIAVQNVLPIQDVPTGLAIVILAQNLGPAIFLSAGNNVFNDKLLKNISALRIPGLDPSAILSAGATSLRTVVPEEHLAAVLRAYNEALRQTFYVALAMSCVGLLGCVFMEVKKVRLETKKLGSRNVSKTSLDAPPEEMMLPDPPKNTVKAPIVARESTLVDRGSLWLKGRRTRFIEGGIGTDSRIPGSQKENRPKRSTL